MLYFVAFIIAHVALVLATGALRNLNHMYASQDAINWVGFLIFAASLIVIAIGLDRRTTARARPDRQAVRQGQRPLTADTVIE